MGCGPQKQDSLLKEQVRAGRPPRETPKGPRVSRLRVSGHKGLGEKSRKRKAPWGQSSLHSPQLATSSA